MTKRRYYTFRSRYESNLCGETRLYFSIMDIDYEENSTSAFFYTEKKSGEWLRENFPLGYFGIIFDFVIKVVGVISNCVILDVVRKMPTPSTSSLWVKQVAICNMFYNFWRFLEEGNFWLRLQMYHYSRATCKVMRFLDMFTLYTPLLHCSALFVDQALFIIKPTWHYKQDWKTKVPKSSAVIIIFCLLYSSTSMALYDIRNESCEAILTPMEAVQNTFLLFLASSSVASSNIVFVVKLRHLRLKQAKKKKQNASNTVEMRSQNAAEGTETVEKFQFSEEDIKAIRYMLTSFISVCLAVLSVHVSSALVVHLVKNRFQADMFHWVLFGWLGDFVLGPFVLLSIVWRENTRKFIKERYFK